MALQEKWGLSSAELITTGLVAAGGLYAIVDGFRLLSQGPPTASWTAFYIIGAGSILILLAGASLLPFSRDSAVRSVSNTVADNVIEGAEEGGNQPVRDEQLPPNVARSLLIRAIIILIGWVLALQVLGYIVATAVFLFAYGLFVSHRRIKTTLVLAFLATAISAGLFQAVGIRLPTGTLF